MNKLFKKSTNFPNEAFIQDAIEKYFLDNGYSLINNSQIDLIASNENETWIIEAKGLTNNIGLDFNTCLGQLAKSMSSPDYIYAIAIPKNIKYKRQCEKLSSYYRKLINLQIIVVDELKNIGIIHSNEEVKDFFAEDKTNG